MKRFTLVAVSVLALAACDKNPTQTQELRLEFLSQPTNTEVESTIPAFRVAVVTGTDTVVSDGSYSITINLSAGPNAALTGRTLEPTILGVATFAGLSIDTVGSGYTLSATAEDTRHSGPSDAFEITALVTTGPDTLYPEQWHLENTAQSGGSAGEDINVVDVWAAGNKGENVVIAVVDDGLEINHKDIRDNVLAGGSYNYNDDSDDPTSGWHGTNCGGVAAARDSNGRGVRGSAPRAQLVGFNLLESSDESNDADAAVRGYHHVNTNSWGPADGYGALGAPALAWEEAIEDGLLKGRGDKGTVYLWAGGNGYPLDNSNYDGFANYHGVMSICAVDHNGVRSSYSEEGANHWVCAPSNGDESGITTVDRTGSKGLNIDTTDDLADVDYTSRFGGTSSATPLAAGVVALVLAANPNLSWRDVKIILARSARKNDAGHADWSTNGAGHEINPFYGFGVVDAAAAVQLAAEWTNVGPQVTHEQSSAPGTAIPDGGAVTDTIAVAGSGATAVEFVEVHFTATHNKPQDLEVILISETTGTESRLSNTHDCDIDELCNATYDNWRFGSARHLDEAADGNWTLRVTDGSAGETGTLTSWSLKFYGR